MRIPTQPKQVHTVLNRLVIDNEYELMHIKIRFTFKSFETQLDLLQ